MTRSTMEKWAFLTAEKYKGPARIYLFLDFDGVINLFPTDDNFEQRRYKNIFDLADRDCVKKLNAFAEDYPIEVVISSSWRYNGLDFCRDYLKNAGMSDKVKFAGMTQTEDFHKRSVDIFDYLTVHPDFSGLLIFDDLSLPEWHEFLVCTSMSQGWTEERDQYARELIRKFHMDRKAE